MYEKYEMNIVSFEEREQFAGVVCWSNQGDTYGPDSYGGDAPSSDM